jgi:hypothetical protein
LDCIVAGPAEQQFKRRFGGGRRIPPEIRGDTLAAFLRSCEQGTMKSNVTAATIPDASAQSMVQQCRRCGAIELKRQRRAIFDRLASVQVLQCGRCAYRQREFKFHWTLPLVILFLCALIATPILIVSLQPSWLRPKETAQSDLDSLSRTRNAMGGQLSTFEQMMTKKPRSTLDNATVLKLWRANVGSDVILQMIRTSNADYDLSANAVIELRQAQVDRTIILAMIDASYTSR